jgi:hypothetical protein
LTPGVKIKSAKNGTSPPLVFEASSQLLNYISARAAQVCEQSKFPSFRHYQPHATVMAKVAQHSSEIKCSKKCQRADSFGIEQFDSSILYISQQPLLRSSLSSTECNEMKHFAPHDCYTTNPLCNTHKAALRCLITFILLYTAVGNKTALMRWSLTSGVYCIPPEIFHALKIMAKSIHQILNLAPKTLNSLPCKTTE